MADFSTWTTAQITRSIGALQSGNVLCKSLTCEAKRKAEIAALQAELQRRAAR